MEGQAFRKFRHKLGVGETQEKDGKEAPLEREKLFWRLPRKRATLRLVLKRRWGGRALVTLTKEDVGDTRSALAPQED